MRVAPGGVKPRRGSFETELICLAKMLPARPVSRLVRNTLAAPGVEPEPRSPSGSVAEWSGLTSVLASANELSACADLDSLTFRAVEMLREHVGLERVGLYLHDTSNDRFIMRGTWGTSADGETTDERGLHYESCAEDLEMLQQRHARGSLWLYHDRVPRFSEETGRSVMLGHGWLVLTPLVAARHVVGVFFNDAALTHDPVDDNKQALAAVFGSVLASLLLARRGTVTWGPLPRSVEHNSVVQWVVRALDQDPLASGERLAHELGISPGHLARSFKTQMGMSLVEYRNRLRIDRFLDTVARHRGSLLEAALQAGFGSYAQFHRVYRKLHGQTPRDHLALRIGPRLRGLGAGD